jgi:hypothetical protein
MKSQAKEVGASPPAAAPAMAAMPPARNTATTQAPAVNMPQPAISAGGAPPAQSNLSGAINQLKAGNNFDAQNTLRKTVGLSEIAAPPANSNPNMSDAISRLKMGDKASADAMLRKMVGLKKGGEVNTKEKATKSTGASKRADGIAQKGKTRGKMC